MSMFNSQEFLAVFKQKFMQVFKEVSKPYIQQKVAKVISVDNILKTAKVRFPQSKVDGTEDITIPDLSNVSLSIGNQVYVFYFGNNLSNAFVAYKKP